MYKWYQTKIGRSFVILIAVATAVSFLPLLGDAGVYAASGEGEAETYYALPDETADGSGFVAEEDALSADELNAELQDQSGAAGAADNPVEITFQDDVVADENATKGQAKADTGKDGLSQCGLTSVETGLHIMGDIQGDTENEDSSDVEQPDEKLTNEELLKILKDKSWMKVDVNSNGIATVTAHIGAEDVYFKELWVDNSCERDVYGKTEIAGLTLDMKEYPVGFHTVALLLGSDEYDIVNREELGLYNAYIPTNIFAKPSLKLSNFFSRCSYFTYSDNYNSYRYDSDCHVYLDYKRAGKEWSCGYGPIRSGSTVKRGRLAAANKYWVRTYYAKKTSYTPPVEYGDKGNPTTITKVFMGPVTGSVGFKTAYKKTPVKSVTAKKVKQWCKKYKVRRLSSKIYWRNGYAGWGYYRKILGTKTYKYWYTKVKVTVTMKKKPGIAGVYIGSKTVKGNKRVYAANFTLAGKKKGKTIKVSVYSFMNRTYGGLSGKTLRKVKVK